MSRVIGFLNGNWRHQWKKNLDDAAGFELDIFELFDIAREVATSMIRNFPELAERGKRRMAELNEQERLLRNITLEAQDIYFGEPS